jgi:hypothetical protein
VYRESHGVAEYAGMGTTLVAAIVRDSHATVANVGDSRAYLYGGGGLSRITTDHSVVEELVVAGRIRADEARFHPQRNLITRALGTSPDVEPDLFEIDLAADGALLLSSDGLHGMIGDGEIARVIASMPRADAACDALVAAALDAGGDDNITVALLRRGDAAAISPLTDPGTLPPGALRTGGRATLWLWLAGIVVAAAAAWVLLVARPWESADNLAPSTPTPPIMIDTSFVGLDSVPIDSGNQLTPYDRLRSLSDTGRTDSGRGADSPAALRAPPRQRPGSGAVTGGR